MITRLQQTSIDRLEEIRNRTEFLIRCGNFAHSTNVVLWRGEPRW